MTTLISVEGNIGSGKSTLLDNLRNYYKNNKTVVFLKEPVDEWENIKDKFGNTMLEKFYSDQKRYSFSFQMMAFISRLVLLKDTIKQNKDAIIITERSLITDKSVFAKMLYDMDNIEDVEYQIYVKWFDHFVSEFPISKIIYVNCDPQICFNRIIERSRTGENEITLDYLKKCNDYHNNMILSFCKKTDVALLELDGNINIKQNNDQLEVWLQKINEFIF